MGSMIVCIMSSFAEANPPTSAHLTSGIFTAFSPKALLSFSSFASLFNTVSLSIYFPSVTFIDLINMLLISLKGLP